MTLNEHQHNAGPNLTAGKSYEVQVRANNAETDHTDQDTTNDSDWSASGTRDYRRRRGNPLRAGELRRRNQRRQAGDGKGYQYRLHLHPQFERNGRRQV